MSVIETMIDIPAEHEQNVCGQFDSYIKKIERTLHVTMVARDGMIKVIGPEGDGEAGQERIPPISLRAFQAGQYHHGAECGLCHLPLLYGERRADPGD